MSNEHTMDGEDHKVIGSSETIRETEYRFGIKVGNLWAYRDELGIHLVRNFQPQDNLNSAEEIRDECNGILCRYTIVRETSMSEIEIVQEPAQIEPDIGEIIMGQVIMTESYEILVGPESDERYETGNFPLPGSLHMIGENGDYRREKGTEMRIPEWLISTGCWAIVESLRVEPNEWKTQKIGYTFYLGHSKSGIEIVVPKDLISIFHIENARTRLGLLGQFVLSRAYYRWRSRDIATQLFESYDE